MKGALGEGEGVSWEVPEGPGAWQRNQERDLGAWAAFIISSNIGGMEEFSSQFNWGN